MSADFDVIVVGSGPSGAHAAQAAVASGAKVAVVDVGHVDHHYVDIVPDRPFSEIRRDDAEQRRYFLGERLEGVAARAGAAGAQLTPPRKFIVHEADERLPFRSSTMRPMQSLALGGLGAGWGAGCATYDQRELQRAGLPTEGFGRYYDVVAAAIGVSGTTEDDVSPDVAALRHLQPPLDLDSNASAIMRTYARRRGPLQARGFRLGRLPMAVLTAPLGDRLPNPYHDMDFWSDHRASVYRPAYTIRRLQGEPQFAYLDHQLAERFVEEDGAVTLLTRDLSTDTGRLFRCRRLILAAGAINTARVALRSLGAYDTRVPMLCNPYTYMPFMNLPMLGRPARDRRHSLAQLTAIYTPPGAPDERLVANLFSYRSLLLFKLVAEMPLPPRLGLLAARLMATSLTIAGIHHPDEPSPLRYVELKRRGASGDEIVAECGWSAEEERTRHRRERRLARHFMTLRCLPLSVVRPAHGASLHYAGTLPYADDDRPLTCTPEGRLRGTRSVYVADASPWRYLPAKGLTLTLMAGARRVGELVAEGVRRDRT